MKSLSPLVTVCFLVGWVLLACVGSIGVGAAQDYLEPPAGMTEWWPGDGNTEPSMTTVVEASRPVRRLCCAVCSALRGAGLIIKVEKRIMAVAARSSCGR
jgi:hypothetical protein